MSVKLGVDGTIRPGNGIISQQCEHLMYKASSKLMFFVPIRAQFNPF